MKGSCENVQLTYNCRLCSCTQFCHARCLGYANYPEYTQAVASMLLGVTPDDMYEETHLQGWNPDIVEKRNQTWAYPPVLLLSAAADMEGYKQRIGDSMKFFQQQVRSIGSPAGREGHPCCFLSRDNHQDNLFTRVHHVLNVRDVHAQQSLPAELCM